MMKHIRLVAGSQNSWRQGWWFGTRKDAIQHVVLDIPCSLTTWRDLHACQRYFVDIVSQKGEMNINVQSMKCQFKYYAPKCCGEMPARSSYILVLLTGLSMFWTALCVRRPRETLSLLPLLSHSLTLTAPLTFLLAEHGANKLYFQSCIWHLRLASYPSACLSPL